MKFITAVLLLGFTSLYAQDGDAYFATIKMTGRSPVVTGFLYSINDSVVVILPARISSKKALTVAIEKAQLTPIPVKLIRKVKLMKLKNVKGAILSGMLVATGYSLVYVSAFPIKTAAGYIGYVAAITAATLLTLDLIYYRKYKPAEPAFALKMQTYCLRNSGLILDR